jgi:hypothetical protein
VAVCGSAAVGGSALRQCARQCVGAVVHVAVCGSTLQCVRQCAAVLQCATVRYWQCMEVRAVVLWCGCAAVLVCGSARSCVQQQCAAVRTILMCTQCARQCAAVRLVVCELCANVAIYNSARGCVRQSAWHECAAVCGSARAAVCGSAHGGVRAVRAAVCVSALGGVWQ